jgi:hypothetical protein
MNHITEHTLGIIVLKPGPTGRPGAGTGPGWRKNRERKNPVWPGDPANPVKTRLQTRWILFFFVFLLKQYRFDFKNKLARPTWWPDQNSKSESWTRPTTGSSLKTMLVFFICFVTKGIEIASTQTYYLY